MAWTTEKGSGFLVRWRDEMQRTGSRLDVVGYASMREGRPPRRSRELAERIADARVSPRQRELSP